MKKWMPVIIVAAPIILAGVLGYGAMSQEVTTNSTAITDHKKLEGHATDHSELARQGEQIKALQEGQDEIKEGVKVIQELLRDRLPRPQ